MSSDTTSYRFSGSPLHPFFLTTLLFIHTYLISFYFNTCLYSQNKIEPHPHNVRKTELNVVDVAIGVVVVEEVFSVLLLLLFLTEKQNKTKGGLVKTSIETSSFVEHSSSLSLTLSLSINLLILLSL
jgi:hypothetical protein